METFCVVVARLYPHNEINERRWRTNSFELAPEERRRRTNRFESIQKTEGRRTDLFSSSEIEEIDLLGLCTFVGWYRFEQSLGKTSPDVTLLYTSKYVL